MTRSISLGRLIPAALLVVIAAGCGQGEGTSTGRDPAAVSPEDSTGTTEAHAAAPTSCEDAHEATSPAPGEVLVYFACDGVGSSPDAFDSFARPVDPNASLVVRLEEAVKGYLAGPLPAEQPGHTPFAGPEAFNAVEVRGTRAVIDINLDGVATSTSAQSAHIWNALRLLTFQFPAITELEPRHNGSCAAFGNAVEAGQCLIALPDGRSVPGP